MDPPSTSSDAPAEGDSAPSLSSRWPELDLLKAVAIGAVVLIHTLRSWPDVGASPFEQALEPALRFAVPAFLFASGALAAPRGAGLSLTLRRLERLLLPYLLASLAAEAFRFLQGEPRPPASVAADLLLGSAFGPFYYVFVAAVLVAAVLLLAVIPRAAASALLPVLLPGLLVAQALSELGVIPLPFFWFLRNPLLWAAYYALGWSYGRRRERLVPARGPWVGATALAAGLGGLGLLLLAREGSGLAPRASRLLVWLAIYATIVAVLCLGLLLRHRLADGLVAATVTLVAGASYPIYLWHLFVVYPLRQALAPPPGELAWLAIIVPWLAGMSVPLLLIALARTLFGTATSRRWFGA